MKTKLTFSELSKFRNLSPVSCDELKEYIGGGDGKGISSAYSLSEYRDMGYAFTRGWVRFDEDKVAYLTETYLDYCKHNNYNGGSDNYSNSGYSGSSYYGGATDYSGSSDSDWYDETNKKISDIISEFPCSTRMEISFNIVYSSVIDSPGKYNAWDNTLYIRDITYDVIYAECLHAIQEKEELCGNNHAAREYQEHVIGDFENYRRSWKNAITHTGEPHVDISPLSNCRTVRGSDYEYEFDEWVSYCYDPNTDEIDMHEFMGKVKRFESLFQSSHSDIPGYQGYIPSDYNYNWREMFEIMGFKIKDEK